MVTATSAGRAQGRRADAAMAALILLLGAFLAWSGAQLAQRLQTSTARRQSLSFEDHIGLVANTTGLIVVVWWVLSFLIAVAAALLERCGSHRAAVAAGKFSPAFMRRLALAAVGLQLATAPLAQASTRAGDPAGQGTAASAVVAAWVPSGGALAAQAVALPRAATPAPDPPAPLPLPRSLGVDPHWTPSPTPMDPRVLAAAPHRDQARAARTAEVTVQTGDSLWSICAEALGPLASDVDVALAWPRLYQANRGVIGPDPGLLLPGQVLIIPVGF
ncbi:LysM peptidoglycan-binding domain-containing protein [Arthrobacter sp. B3I4]|uniref:LysM peptidoglycan-binding domain-containing protein n=1 Tax=Arthrobacter sp. B3I4 TaxID=3042267 RepID=UPI00277DCEA8|nr:LysM domain-containing protein [Arthrobacter sp. B3I4]MDQ0755743.1 nucleoid-associated protein YgaU [Arthrobacter sp. B3I4]